MWGKLKELPSAENDTRVHGRAPWSDEKIQASVRRYTADTRKQIEMHADRSDYTINIALNGHQDHEGGDLLALVKAPDDVNQHHDEGRHERTKVQFVRGQGTATMHTGDFRHSVTEMVTGTRYTLIIFVFNIS